MKSSVSSMIVSIRLRVNFGGYVICNIVFFTQVDTSQWLPDGCTTVVNETGEVTCICNHLTNFAVRTVSEQILHRL